MKEFKPIVSQSNEFIRNYVYTQNMGINDIKVFKTIISKINYNNTLFDEFYVLDYNDLDLVGVPKRDRFNVVKKSLKKLSSTFVTLKGEDRIRLGSEDDDDIEMGLIHNKFNYPRRTTKIKVVVDRDLKPFLLELKKKYTTYELENLFSFNKTTEVLLYELFSSWKNRETFFITIENLKTHLGLIDVYPRYGNFKSKVLIPHLEKIYENTDLIVNYTELTKNRTVVQTNRDKVFGINFTITDKNGYQNYNPSDLKMKRFKDRSGKVYRIMEVLVNDNKEYDLLLYSEELQKTTNLFNKFMDKDELVKKVFPYLLVES